MVIFRILPYPRLRILAMHIVVVMLVGCVNFSSLFCQSFLVDASQLHRLDTLDFRPEWCSRDAIDAIMSETYFSLPYNAPRHIAEIRLLAWSADRMVISDSLRYTVHHLLYVIVYQTPDGKHPVSLMVVDGFKNPSIRVVLDAPEKSSSIHDVWRLSQYPYFGVYLDSTSPGYDTIPARNRYYPIVRCYGGWSVPPAFSAPDTIDYESLWKRDALVDAGDTLVDTTDMVYLEEPRTNDCIGAEEGSIYHSRLWMQSNLLESPTQAEIDSFLTTPCRFYNTVPALRMIGLFEYGTFGTSECRYQRILEAGAVRERTWQYLFGFPPAKDYLPKP